MKKLAAVIVAVAAIATANAQKNDTSPEIQIFIISPSQTLCMGAQQRAIETLSTRQKGKELWSTEEVTVYLASVLPKAKSADLARLSIPVMQAVNDSIAVMMTQPAPSLSQASDRLALITTSCMRSIRSGSQGSSI
jgi:hypothetical protein